ncbi:LPXTG cell wall anchor domain-containing protein [Bacillus fungorum]|uniref:Gram-positive cocci surface proteins LPxTG domain-containing protein n=1 Tax=Bacillus fungorum TaxID=2039284 RepID=A0A2G6QBZ5_9BACI|nr:LPXTG cell wall anchor domain-containing protein [Bacillus fungorum]PIE94354.1 hypothetical protein CO726_16100 [Bacillus fungorum]
MALLTVGYSSVASADTGTVTKEEATQLQQDKAKKEVEKPVVQGEKLPNTASNNGAMRALSACLVGIGTLFGLKRRNKVKA